MREQRWCIWFQSCVVSCLKLFFSDRVQRVVDWSFYWLSKTGCNIKVDARLTISIELGYIGGVFSRLSLVICDLQIFSFVTGLKFIKLVWLLCHISHVGRVLTMTISIWWIFVVKHKRSLNVIIHRGSEVILSFCMTTCITQFLHSHVIKILCAKVLSRVKRQFVGLNFTWLWSWMWL